MVQPMPMQFSNRTENALIAVYGDTQSKDIARSVALYLPDKDVRILEPEDEETLEMAAQNSVLVFIGVKGPHDQNLDIARHLQSSRLVAADTIGVTIGEDSVPSMEILAKGFDCCISLKETRSVEFRKYLAFKINKGVRRLNGLIQEEEYRRLNDALSVAPVSMIIFDADKRAVFVSDHYFRAYPKIAPRLIRGLRVYDAFEMMAKEEGLSADDPRYHEIRQFWHNLDGKIEFTVDDGTTYRLRAIKLSSNRGTMIAGQNVSEYVRFRQNEEKRKQLLNAMANAPPQ